jgi:radical SAM superfamily enzyme YgiQ (UPF0313 family)
VALGILKVAAVLERAGVRVEHCDLSGIENYVEVASIAARNSGATHICLTATTPQLPAAVRIAREIRTEWDGSRLRLILGGPHSTLTYSAVKLEVKRGRVGRAHKALDVLQDLFDVLVVGDGETAIFEALKANPERIIDADERLGGMFMDDAIYASMPMPARHLVDMNSYHYAIEGHRATTLIAQLGCPFGCGFCAGRNSRSLRLIRMRPTESIIEEIKHLHKTYGFTGFNFFDDELNVNKEFLSLLNAVTDLQSRLGVEFRLRGFVKSELFDATQAEAMYRAGFRWVLCGFEAANERILVNIDKKATLEDNTRVVDLARSAGLKTKALMSIGHPGESEESVLNVRDWLISVHPDDFDCTIITPYPGSPYYDEALPHSSIPDAWTFAHRKTGDRLHAYDVNYTEVADYYKGDPDGGYHSYVFTDYLTGKELVTLRDALEKDVRNVLKIPFNPAAPSKRYDHSMGQGPLPEFILRST